MKIEELLLQPYTFTLIDGQIRSGAHIHIMNEMGEMSVGDTAPLTGWSKETLDEAVQEITQKQSDIVAINWTLETWLQDLARLKLLPSVSFGLESALLALLDPLPSYNAPASALLMGTPEEILEQARLRKSEGYKSAKLKIKNLTFDEAKHVICELKDQFLLRIDVNRAWSTEEALKFFSQFPLDTFDYVEEPFQNPHDLKEFPHPLAIDESLAVIDLEPFSNLKAIIYKPTIRGGMLGCLPLHAWAKKRGISLVLSSSFESVVGLAHITAMARRLQLLAPVGIGTYHFF